MLERVEGDSTNSRPYFLAQLFSNALPKLRETAAAYVQAGAIETWIAFPNLGSVDIYGHEGRRHVSTFGIDVSALLA